MKKVIRMTAKLIKHYLGHQFVLRHNHIFTYDCLICGLDVEDYADNFVYVTNLERKNKVILTCEEWMIKKLLE